MTMDGDRLEAGLVSPGLTVEVPPLYTDLPPLHPRSTDTDGSSASFEEAPAAGSSDDSIPGCSGFREMDWFEVAY